MDVSRRDAIKIISGVGISVAVMPLLGGVRMALGDSIGGDDTNPSEGGGGGDGLDSFHGGRCIWFDRGGFTQQDGGGKKPTQGWSLGDNKAYFHNLMTAEANATRKALGQPQNITGLRTTDSHRQIVDGKRYSSLEWLEECMKNARNDAIDKETARANREGYWYSGKARVVGVAWGMQMDDDLSKTWYQFVESCSDKGTTLVFHRTFTSMFNADMNKSAAGRLGTGNLYTGGAAPGASGYVASSDGWASHYDGTESWVRPSTTWRDAVWEFGKQAYGNEEKRKLIVIAVADGFPRFSGYLRVSKRFDA